MRNQFILNSTTRRLVEGQKKKNDLLFYRREWLRIYFKDTKLDQFLLGLLISCEPFFGKMRRKKKKKKKKKKTILSGSKSANTRSQNKKNDKITFFSA